MAYDPNIRVSDADRERTAQLLQEHFSAGRLSQDEFTERMDRAYAAKTIGEIDALLADLPRIDLYRLPDATLTRDPRQLPPAGRRGRRSGWRRVWGAWLVISLICVADWASGAARHTWWPLWVAGSFGLLIGGSWLISLPFRSGPQPGLGQRPGQGELPQPGDDLPGRPGQ